MTTIANQGQRQDQCQDQMQELTLSNLVSNFPFKEIRPKQLEVLQQIAGIDLIMKKFWEEMAVTFLEVVCRTVSIHSPESNDPTLCIKI